MSKDILDKALEKALTESYDELIESDMPDYDFSDSFEDKMSALIKEQDRAPVIKRSRIFMIASAAAAIAVLGVSVSALHYFRPKLNGIDSGDIIEETTDNGSDNAPTNENDAENMAATATNTANGNTTTAKYTNTTNTKTTGTFAAEGKNSSSGKGNAFQTATTVRNGQETTETTTIVVERSFSMNKLGPMSASLLVLASLSAENVKAAIDEIPLTKASAWQYIAFEEMDKGNIRTDINMDGKFDIMDCFDIIAYEYGYETDEAVAARIKENYDFNGDGHIYAPEPECLLAYYVVNNKITLKDVDPDTYSQWDKIATDEQAESFVWLDPVAPNSSNDIATDRTSLIDRDNYNRFATYDYREIPGYQPERFDEYEADFRNYLKGRKLSEIFTGKLKGMMKDKKAGYYAFCEFIENGTVDMDIDKNGIISIRDYERLMDLYPDVPAGFKEAAHQIGGMFYNDYPLWYCIEQSELLTDQEEMQHYIDCIKGRLQGSIYVQIKYTYDLLHPAEAALTYSFPLFDIEYENCYDKLAKGEAKLPDSNGDGVLDVYDYWNAQIFIQGRKKGAVLETSILPDEIWKTFMRDFDINGNGLSGDVHDIEIYYLCLDDFATDVETYREWAHNNFMRFRNYKLKLIEEKGVDDGTLAMYQKKNPAETFERVNSGDVNNDGRTDAIDASKVLSYYAKLSTDGEVTLSAKQIKAADINGDEVIDAVDASNILAYYARVSTSSVGK